MERMKVIFGIFLVFVGLIYLNPPSSYKLCDLFKAAINRANLTVNYCLCQDFSHPEYGWRGPLYVMIYTVLFLWWFLEVLKADRRRVRRSEERRLRETRQELRTLRLNAWFNEGYPRESGDQADVPPRQRRRGSSSRLGHYNESESSVRVPEPSFSRQYWRSWSAPP